jgi:hypothetical protein
VLDVQAKLPANYPVTFEARKIQDLSTSRQSLAGKFSDGFHVSLSQTGRLEQCLANQRPVNFKPTFEITDRDDIQSFHGEPGVWTLDRPQRLQVAP